MSKKANPAAIGAFVLVALILLSGALAVLGSGKLFKRVQRYVLFFDGSLSGLDVGAPVEYRGVRVGSVTRILLKYDTAQDLVAIPVYIELEPDRVSFKGERRTELDLLKGVEAGLRAQLQAQSYITGKLKVMLVDSPGTPMRLIGGDPETPEIPTMPKVSEQVWERLQDLPVADIILNANRAMEAVAQLMASSQLSNALVRMSSILDRMDVLAATVNRHLPEVMQSAQKNADQLLLLQSDIDNVLEEVKEILADRSPERQQAILTLRGLEDAAISLKDLLSYLQLHPEALISGKQEN